MPRTSSRVPRLLPAICLLAACVLAADATLAEDLLRVEEVVIPSRVPAGTTVPISARFCVVEPIRDGWRVSAELVPVAGGRKFVTGPVSPQFDSQTPPGTERTVSISVPVPVPEDAASGTYRVVIDYYDGVDDKWVHIRHVSGSDKPPGCACRRSSRDSTSVAVQALPTISGNAMDTSR